MIFAIFVAGPSPDASMLRLVPFCLAMRTSGDRIHTALPRSALLPTDVLALLALGTLSFGRT